MLMFEAQLAALGIEDDKKKETLLSLLEGNAFSRAAQYITITEEATYAHLKAEMERLFSGEEYKRALETKMRTLMFTKDSNIPHFCNQLRLVIGELFGITDAPTIEKMVPNDVMSKFDGTAREPLKMLQLAVSTSS